MAVYSASKPTADGEGRVEIIFDTDSEQLRIYGADGQVMSLHFSTLSWINFQIEVAYGLENEQVG